MNVLGFDGWTLTAAIVLLSVVWTMVLLANALVEVGTDRVPRASDGSGHTAHVFHIQPQPVHSRDIRDYLRHSGICEDPAVVSAVAGWIATGYTTRAAESTAKGACQA